MKIKSHINVDQQKGGRMALHRVDNTCSPRELCVRCSLMKIVQYRFKVFRRTFGRDPLAHEPLFFSPDARHPEVAATDQVIKQLEQAARATRVRLPPLLEFLGLA